MSIDPPKLSQAGACGLLHAVLDDLPCGLSVWDTSFSLLLWNAQFLTVYGLTPDDVDVGVSLRSVIERVVAVGNHPRQKTSELLRAYRRQMSSDDNCKMVSVDEQFSDDRIINVKRKRVPKLGWVVLHEDVTKKRKRQRSLETQRARLEAAVSNMAEGLCMFDKNSRLVISNDHYEKIYGLPPELVKPGTHHKDIVAYRMAHGMESSGGAEGFLERHQASLDTLTAGVELVRLANGRTIMIRHQPLKIGGWVATHHDLTEQKQRERDLEEQNVRFDAAINNMHHGLCMFNADKRLIVSNRLFAEMYRLPLELIKPGMSLDEVLDLRLEYGNEPVTGEDRYKRRRHEVLEDQRVQSDIIELRDGRVITIHHHPMKGGGWVATHQDITEQRRNQERIHHLARHDALTDLPNRVVFQERIEGEQAPIARGSGAAVLCIDLDKFKAVNDTLGHASGDQVLKAAAERLQACCRETDTVARLGGDEFAILQTAVKTPSDAAALARNVVARMAEPFDIEDHRFLVGASVGIAVAPIDGTDAATLLRNADLALYRAKSEGRGTFHFFEPGMDAALQRRRAIEAGLRRALSRNELKLAFQPLLNVQQGQICSVEALLRWHDPERGEIAPADFIPVAEETGLIVPIGEWVLQEACATAATWPEQIGVAVNLSPVQFKARGLVDQVKAALDASGLDPRRLELEITESVLLHTDMPTLDILHRLRELGIRICMDDFGTGYSSLSYLRSFPFEKIKIDRSFVRDSSSSDEANAIVKAVIKLGESLGITTTAEGVETQAQLELVREHGCTEAQGFLFGRPLPAEAIGELLTRSQPSTRSRHRLAS